MKTEYDAIVIGTGVSGGWAAKELCEKGLKTLQIDKYCARRFGLSSFLATRFLKTQNTFNLLAKK